MTGARGSTLPACEPIAARGTARAAARACIAVSLLAPVASLADDDARLWLDRMMEAAQTINYDGTFVYRKGDMMESMRIIHRADPDGQRERLISLNGSPREVLRDRDLVRCILPDDQSIVVAKSRPKGLPSHADVLSRAGISEHYVLSSSEGVRVAGRDTRSIVVDPADEYRYGYRLWLDRDTGLLLRSELFGDEPEPLEEIVYTSIQMPKSIPDELLEPGIDGEGFTIKDMTEAPGAPPASDGPPRWRAGWLPKGFEMSASEGLADAERNALEQLVYSDGLATVSVFIERLDQPGDALEGASRMGALSAYGRVVDGFQVTVVGEVPPVTVEQIGQNVTRSE